MGKVIVLVLLVIVVAVLFRQWGKKLRDHVEGRSDPPPAPPPASETGSQGMQQMVTCVHCGVHLPQNEALLPAKVDGSPPTFFCSAEHRDLWQRKA